MRLLDELLIPDSQPASPYGYARNQIAHAALGAAAAWLWLPLAGLLIAGVVALQVVHTRRGGTVWDAVEDVAFVALGAAIVLAGLAHGWGVSVLAMAAATVWLGVGMVARS